MHLLQPSSTEGPNTHSACKLIVVMVRASEDYGYPYTLTCCFSVREVEENMLELCLAYITDLFSVSLTKSDLQMVLS